MEKLLLFFFCQTMYFCISFNFKDIQDQKYSLISL